MKQFYVIEVASCGSKRVNESLVLDIIDVKSKIIAPSSTENPWTVGPSLMELQITGSKKEPSLARPKKAVPIPSSVPINYTVILPFSFRSN